MVEVVAYSAEIIDISGRVGDQFYDQYTDAANRAVGDYDPIRPGRALGPSQPYPARRGLSRRGPTRRGPTRRGLSRRGLSRRGLSRRVAGSVAARLVPSRRRRARQAPGRVCAAGHARQLMITFNRGRYLADIDRDERRHLPQRGRGRPEGPGRWTYREA